MRALLREYRIPARGRAQPIVDRVRVVEHDARAERVAERHGHGEAREARSDSERVRVGCLTSEINYDSTGVLVPIPIPMPVPAY